MAVYARDEYSEKYLQGPGCLFGLSWIVVSTVGWIIGVALSDWVQLLSLPSEYEGLVVQAVSGLVIGLSIGAMQAAVLLPYLKIVGALQWIGATMLGRAVRVLLISLLSGTLLELIPSRERGVLFLGVVVSYFGAMAVIGAVAGAATGYAQHFVLERRVGQAWRWGWVNAGASVLIFVASAVISYSSMTSVVPNPTPYNGVDYGAFPPSISNLDEGPAFDIVINAVAAAITGFVLMDMLRRPTTQAEWSVRLKREDSRPSKQVSEAQPSPEAMLEAQRRKK